MQVFSAQRCRHNAAVNPPAHDSERSNRWVRQALEVLGVDHLALIVFDAMLPRDRSHDLGTGTPYSSSARTFFEFVAGLGFNGIQFGPQGAVSRDFPSPYDGTALSRNPLSIAIEEIPNLAPFADVATTAWDELLPMSELETSVEQRPNWATSSVAHTHAFDHQHRILSLIADRLTMACYTRGGAELRQRFARFCSEHEHWLTADGLYDPLCRAHRATDFTQFDGTPDACLWQADWTAPAEPAVATLLGHHLRGDNARRLRELVEHHDHSLERYRWLQFIVHSQHESLHEWTKQLGLELFGDMHVGYSRRDLWHYRSVFLSDYALGAPPSRTNPDGQPWGCPVLDPELYFERDGNVGPALRLLTLRARKAFLEYDRLRIDHPHGLICPWVYRRGTSDDLEAVQTGARLFSSPDLPDHPALARYAIVGPRDLDPAQARHADDWVRTLSDQQIRKFATAFDVLAQQAKSLGSVDRLLCEVLSTQPRELGAVLQSYGLGRFRVTQKANVEDPSDVYLSDNAEPEDWMMLGNHDTIPIWQVVERWQETTQVAKQANYLARRLCRDESDRTRLRTQLCSDTSLLAHAKLADLFVAKSRSVAVSFSDLFGFKEPYNVPGTVAASNWSQRLPENFAAAYEQNRANGRALDLERALRIALKRVAPNSPLLGDD